MENNDQKPAINSGSSAGKNAFIEKLKRLKLSNYFKSIKGDPIKIRVAFIILALLAVFGVLDSLVKALGYGQVFQSASGMLDDSMKSSATATLSLVGIKSLLAMIKSIELDLLLIQGTVGGLFHGPYEAIDFAFRFFLASTGLIGAQIGLIRIIELVALPLLVGLGSFSMAINPSAQNLFGRIGRLLIVLGLVLFFFYPSTTAIIAGGYEQHRITAEIEYNENMAILSQRTGDLSLGDLRSSSGRESVRETISEGVGAIWTSFTNLIVSYVMMFVILPLAALGLSFLLVRQSMQSLDFDRGVERMEGARTGLVNWVGGKDKNDASDDDTNQKQGVQQ